MKRSGCDGLEGKGKVHRWMRMGKAINEVMADDDLRMCCHVFGLAISLAVVLNIASYIPYDC
jgi:hypothetical protein